MFVFPSMKFEGDRGKHVDQSGQDCAGRVFDVIVVGTGGAYGRTVGCTRCQRRLRAYNDSLAPEPAPEFLAFI